MKVLPVGVRGGACLWVSEKDRGGHGEIDHKLWLQQPGGSRRVSLVTLSAWSLVGSERPSQPVNERGKQGADAAAL